MSLELTVGSKQQRLDASEECLALLNNNEKEFFRRSVTLDKIWLQYTGIQKSLQSKTRIQSEKRRQSRPVKRVNVYILDCEWNNILWLLPKKSHRRQFLWLCTFGFTRGWNRKETTMFAKEKCFCQDNAPSDKLITMEKLNELGFELLTRLLFSPDLASSDFFLFSDPKRIRFVKKFRFNDEIITITEAYFDKRKNLKVVSKCWKITFLVVSSSNGSMFNNKIEFLRKIYVFCLSYPTD